LSLRQSLIMSNGYWTIFFTRPIALVLFLIAAALLLLSLVALLRKRTDWRTKLAQAEAGEAAQ
jgi:TctA family transporter